MRAKIAKLLVLTAPFFLLISCGEDEPEIVPDIPVHIEFNLNEPFYNAITVPMGTVKITNVGYNNNGIIVFRLNQEEILAFDATCPQHIAVNASVALDENGSGTATCPHCHTVYYFYNNGYPAKGYKLKSYRVSFRGDLVGIYN